MNHAFSTIGRGAKYSNMKFKRYGLSLEDFAVGLYLLQDQEELASFFNGIVWPESVVKCAQDYKKDKNNRINAFLTPTQDSISFYLTLKRFEYKPKELVAFAIQYLIEASILKGTPDYLKNLKENSMKDSKTENSPQNSKELTVDGYIKGRDAIYKRAESIRQYITERMVGNETAIDALLSGWSRTKFNPLLGNEQHSGPLGVFTFAGAPGAGKTYLAKLFAEALGVFDENKFHFKVIDCTRFSDRNSSWYLIGLDEGWSTGKEGELTSIVKENPYHVILFDEFEKMHTATMNTLLTLLNDGYLIDQYKSEVVDFSNTYIVFTTNLGREVFESNQLNSQLTFSDSQSVFEILRSSKLPSIGGYSEHSFLPGEFVSRLERGEAVWFSGLKARELLALLEKTSSSTIPSFINKAEFEGDFLLTALLTMLPNISARKISMGSFIKMLEELLDSIVNVVSANKKDASNTPNPNLKFLVGQEVKESLQRLFERNSADMVLVDLNKQDDFSDIFDLAAGQFIKTNPGARLTYQKYVLSPQDESSDLIDKLMKLQAPMVFLDLSISASNDEAHERTLHLLHQINHQMPDAEVFCFGQIPRGMGEVFVDEIKNRVVNSGGARDVLLFSKADGSLINSIMELLTNYRLEKIFQTRERIGKSLEFLTPDIDYDEERNQVNICFNRTIDTSMVNAQDIKDGVVAADLPKERFSDVAGLNRAKYRLKQVLNLLREPALLNSFGIKPPKGFLLSGPLGTGKTLLARALAGEAELPFFSLSVGELSKHSSGVDLLKKYFAAARKVAPSLLFLDEIDSIALSRDSGSSSHILNELLTQMDGFQSNQQHVFLLAATNVADQLDSALVRPGRFDEVIPIDLPEASARREFFKHVLKKHMDPDTLSDEASFERLVSGTAGLSPAEMDRIVREAIYMLVAQDKDAKQIGWASLEDASSFVRFGARKAISLENDKLQKEIVALHEAGHAVVSIALFGVDSVDYLSVIPREGDSSEFMDWDQNHLTNKSNIGSKSQYQNRTMLSLAGRAAEYIYRDYQTDSLSPGAYIDLDDATTLAYDAISKLGIEDEHLMVSYQNLPSNIKGSLGNDVYQKINIWVREAFDQSILVLENNQKLHDALTKLLIEKETIYGSDIQELLQAFPINK